MKKQDFEGFTVLWSCNSPVAVYDKSTDTLYDILRGTATSTQHIAKFRKHSRYKLYDDYDNDMELLGAYANMRQVQKAARERHIDTDGECCLLLYKFNLAAGKYELVNEWYYTMED